MYIYKITNLINGKIYIGQTTRSINESKSYYGSGFKIKGEIYKYGKENFSKDIIEVCYTKEELDLKEEYWISYYDSTNPEKGLNLRTGGNKSKFSDEFKEKMSNALSGENNPFFGKNHSEESIKKMVESKIGKKNPNYGKSMKDSTKEKLSKALTGIKRSNDTKEKMSKAAKKRTYLETKCPHCNKVGSHNMKRYHFDNCKWKA